MNRPITNVELRTLTALLAFDNAPNRVSDEAYLKAEADLHRCLTKLKAERAAPYAIPADAPGPPPGLEGV